MGSTRSLELRATLTLGARAWVPVAGVVDPSAAVARSAAVGRVVGLGVIRQAAALVIVGVAPTHAVGVVAVWVSA